MNDNVWHVTGIDVHNFIETQKNLEEREAILEAVLKASPSLVGYVDAQQTYRYVNEGYAQQWGVAIPEIVGKRVADFLPPDSYKDAEPHIKRVLTGKRQAYLLDVRTDDGEQQKLSVVYEPVFDSEKNVKGFAVDVMDHTLIYSNAESLQNIENLLGRSLERSNYSVFVLDLKKLTINYANSSALSRLGFDVGVPIPEGTKITRLTPTWGDKAWHDWIKSYKAGQDLVALDTIIFDSNKDRAVGDLIAGIIDTEEGQQVILQVFDNSSRAMVLSDLEARSEELATSNRDLEQFASVVAHDLRAPLRHITQFSSLIAAEIPEKSTESITEYLDIITSSATRMADMVDGLLSYAQIGRMLPSFEKLDLGSCVSSAVDMLAADLEDSKARIGRDNLDVDIIGDNDLIVGLLQNLISNAVKYCEDGQSPDIRISAVGSPDKVTLVVEDDGIGIAREHADTIFKLFKRLHADNEYDGLGVGLATCQRIAEIHGGSISLDPDYTSGARFLVDLPLHAAG